MMLIPLSTAWPCSPAIAPTDPFARSFAHFATRHEKFVIPGRYPSFAHITISSLLDFSVEVQRVAITGWICAPLVTRMSATRPSPENQGLLRALRLISLFTSARAS